MKSQLASPGNVAHCHWRRVKSCSIVAELWWFVQPSRAGEIPSSMTKHALPNLTPSYQNKKVNIMHTLSAGITT
jgi:hypothetical protein